MKKEQDTQFYKGYVAGYHDGLTAARNGTLTEFGCPEWINHPITRSDLSTRAINCLLRVGCACTADIVELSEHSIETMRNLGTKTAAEIAHWLDDHGIHYSAWCKYL